MRPIFAAAFASLVATATMAQDYPTLPSPKSVTDTMDALVEAVENAGASVVARVDHAKAAEDAGMELPQAQLLIFGNPQIGTPAMQADIRAGVMLPLRVLVYEDDDGETQILYQDLEAMFQGLEIPADAPFITNMKGALDRVTGAASMPGG